ncbi:MAG: AAA family ATPase [Myxococcota bacterium]
MIKRMKIVGLGPHLDFRAELDPRGENTVTGPSESGKSFLVEAVLFALYGRSTAGRFRPEAIHDGGTRALVELTLDSGLTVRRTITRSRSTTRAVVLGTEETSYGSEAQLAEALGPLGRDPEAVHTVLVPQSWQELASGNARKLRDLLARVLPSVGQADIIRALVAEEGFELQPGEEGLTDAQAGARRRDARKLRDESAGRVQLSAERLAALQDATQAAPSEIALDADLAVRVDAWEAYDRAARGMEQAAARKRAADEWDTRSAALGDEPAAPGPDERAEIQTGQATVQMAMQQVQQLAGQQQMLTMQRQMFSAGTDVCPTCQRPGWDQGAVMVTQLDQQLATLSTQVGDANARWQAAQAELAAAMERHQANEARRAQHSAWSRSKAALGPRPPDPEQAEVPSAPSGSRPTDAEVQSVRQYRARAAALETLQNRQTEELRAARAALETETQRQALADREAARWDALLDAIRKAPSVVAAQQAHALGDMGPVTLQFGENPAVAVLIDGRPWWLASRGRQVVADAQLRNALRRAMEMPHLPLFVDNVQDVGGQPLPELPGPVVWLQTTDGKGLFVRRKTTRGESTSSA